MKHISFIIASFTLALTFVSCGSSNITRGSNYPKMYEEKPVSILIMPPINNTLHVEAKEYFYSSLAQPFCEKGYYVVSPFLAFDFLKEESAYDSELFLENNLSQFKTVFGVDAVLFTIITDWSKSALMGNVSVGIEYVLKSTVTNDVLFRRQGNVSVNTSISGGGGGLIGFAVDLAATAINTALTDKIIAARKCNTYVLSDLPEGVYSTMYGKDGNMAAGPIEFKNVKAK